MSDDTRLSELLKEIKKEYGEGAVITGDHIEENIDIIPTGAITLDVALGVGGIPRGRITEIFGNESCGKTTLASHVVANAQNMGLRAAYIDVENAYDMKYAEVIGVDRSALLFSQPSSGEQAIHIVEKLTKSGLVGLIIIDSVANLVPEKELEDGKSEMGGIARLMSASLRRLTSVARESNTAIIFINQVRMKLGVVYGSPETTPGGKALPFHTSVRIRLAKSGGLKEEGEFSGNEIKAKVIKNKVAPPLKEAVFNIMFGHGIDTASCILQQAVDCNIIEKKSSYYMIGDSKYNGATAAAEALSSNDDLLNEIYDRIITMKLPHLLEKHDEPSTDTANV